ncbi:uncharacterized protein LOC109712560 [Ananas comosus]|uniref:Uncharacterized protein LOC109712560 n=1 Tax=Ananas comosus TaxID=4615 RepID=A0A6P5FED5_ANACO|nr:uncharacterized protein LOC109712560 [Ananas comosus]
MATRSPSPNPSRHSNPHNSKTPEAINPTRKSVIFNSSKTPNPCDSPLRSSCSKIVAAAAPSLRSSFEHKENERDSNSSKPAKMRSPTAASLKGPKNFMAPTISASSKAIAASPRKKILGERNELVRSSSFTSVSDSFQSPSMEKIVPQSDLPLRVSNISSEGVAIEEIGSKPEVGFHSQDALSGIEPKKMDLEVKNHHHTVLVPSFSSSSSSPSSVIAPLDADPSLPPYDPKTNYLSPRPQFLHYKPNPRIENYLNGGGDIFEMVEGKRLEDSFSSESCEESSEHAEEDESSSREKNSVEEFFSEAEAEECINGADASKPECLPNSHRNRVNSRLSLHLRCAPLVLVLLIACLCVPLSDSPIISSSSILKAPTFAKFRELYGVDNIVVSGLYLRDLATRVGDWSTQSFAYYYTSTGTYHKEEGSSFCAANLTASAADPAVDVDQKYIEKNAIQEETRRENCEANQVAEENIEKEPVIEYEEEKRGEVEVREGQEIVHAENEAVRVEIDAVVVEEVKEDNMMELEVETEVHEDLSEDGMKEVAEVGGFGRNEAEVEIKSESIESEPQEVEIQKDGAECNLPLAGTVLNDYDGFDVNGNGNTEEHQTSHGLKLEEIMQNGSEHKISMKMTAGLAFLIVSLATASIFLHMKRKQSLAVATESPSPKEVTAKSVSGSSESYLRPKGSPYQNSLIYMEMMGDSGPSELSTSLNNSASSYGRQRSRKVEGEEALSNEKRLRRDSAVSSSSSFGSFTTYEKISCKKGNRDEEAMTPVRRSSRIRNLVASP